MKVPAIEPDDLVEVRHRGTVILTRAFEYGGLPADSDEAAGPPEAGEAPAEANTQALVDPQEAEVPAEHDSADKRGLPDDAVDSPPQAAAARTDDRDLPTRTVPATTVAVVALIVWTGIIGYVVLRLR